MSISISVSVYLYLSISVSTLFAFIYVYLSISIYLCLYLYISPSCRPSGRGLPGSSHPGGSESGAVGPAKEEDVQADPAAPGMLEVTFDL